MLRQEIVKNYRNVESRYHSGGPTFIIFVGGAEDCRPRRGQKYNGFIDNFRFSPTIKGQIERQLYWALPEFKWRGQPQRAKNNSFLETMRMYFLMFTIDCIGCAVVCSLLFSTKHCSSSISLFVKLPFKSANELILSK